MALPIKTARAEDRPKTILVIDDDPAFLRTLRYFLSAEGYEVLEAADGRRALALLDAVRGEVDLAIVDLCLPELSGFEVIGRLAQKLPAVKVLATTGVFADHYLHQSLHLGAHAAVRKPPSETAFPGAQWIGLMKDLLSGSACSA